ncbi:PH domain-containing protein [Enterococcus cecorum]|uniref:PH domain-containing protein n=1 Tax=Enterococcus cecorum TaxID=44008 RepID=A0AAW9JJC6_9ENTE|nr:PH domain-containing protein [Enterococcus cecorum]MDZ5504941.1 PH domain-containing protein [Enterococcus cecorum]MDZ5532374.1 PH domain-containing protein [Enterococcus cecorum]MDZ5545735.1 PH domain-containing protein [Enterococcus cecorum]MDZ5550300.1 PH domain-containing protein [Enterococcus cecorum]MDZ5552472.1 PH domain-containing protein [Enterococcus cecorum]
MSKKNHYSKLYLLFAPLRSLVKLIWQIVLLFVLSSIFGKDRDYLSNHHFWLYVSLASLGIFALAVGYHIACYLTQTYELTEDALIFRKGIFVKQEIIVPYERMQTIKKNQWFYMVPFGLVRLMVETAAHSGKEAEVDLPMVPYALYDELQARRRNETLMKPKEKTRQADFALSSKDLLIFALTELTLLAPVFLMLGALEFIPDSLQDRLLGNFSHMIILAAVGFFCIAYLISAIIMVLKTVLKYANFQIFQESTGALRIEYGLIEQKSQVIPMSKIQGVRIKQNIFRLFFGLVSLDLLIAGGQEKQEGGKESLTSHPILIPVTKISEADTYLKQFLPDFDFQVSLKEMQQLRLWYFSRFKFLIIAIPIGAYFVFHFAIWQLALAIVLLAALSLGYAYYQSKSQAYGMNERFIVFRDVRLLERVQTILPRKNIQSLEMRTSRWLYPKQLGHCKLNVKAGDDDFHTELNYIPLADIEQMIHFYRKNA